jgi:hypothetical protein
MPNPRDYSYVATDGDVVAFELDEQHDGVGPGRHGYFTVQHEGDHLVIRWVNRSVATRIVIYPAVANEIAVRPA